jgi:hypothetical protein
MGPLLPDIACPNRTLADGDFDLDAHWDLSWTDLRHFRPETLTTS